MPGAFEAKEKRGDGAASNGWKPGA
jgi:hypothetical protein